MDTPLPPSESHLLPDQPHFLLFLFGAVCLGQELVPAAVVPASEETSLIAVENQVVKDMKWQSTRGTRLGSRRKER